MRNRWRGNQSPAWRNSLYMAFQSTEQEVTRPSYPGAWALKVLKKWYFSHVQRISASIMVENLSWWARWYDLSTIRIPYRRWVLSSDLRWYLLKFQGWENQRKYKGQEKFKRKSFTPRAKRRLKTNDQTTRRRGSLQKLYQISKRKSLEKEQCRKLGRRARKTNPGTRSPRN